jgi:ABC-2 type transport system ATP-binding protein
MIRLRNVTKAFGPRVAVDQLSLHIPPGEIYGLLGHNGAGKSTAIGMMLGQVWPTSGEVMICGYDVTHDRQHALHGVGAIFETPAFYDFLSGQANLEILTSYTGKTPRTRIAEVLEWVGLAGREKSKVRTYSHGMRARLALAQALLPNPQLLILDEPGEGLDPEGIHDLRQTIGRLHRELGLTILLSSHLLAEVEQVCTCIGVLKQGRKMYEGSVKQARDGADWLRLKVSDFGQASSELRTAKLIVDVRGVEMVQPADGVGSDAIVRRLVETGISVYEIARAEHTLEQFYLDLMKDGVPPVARTVLPASSSTDHVQGSAE